MNNPKHWDMLSVQSLGSQIPAPRPAEPRPNPQAASRAGKVRPVILLWALGVPLPLLLIVLLIRSCVG